MCFLCAGCQVAATSQTVHEVYHSQATQLTDVSSRLVFSSFVILFVVFLSILGSISLYIISYSLLIRYCSLFLIFSPNSDFNLLFKVWCFSGICGGHMFQARRIKRGLVFVCLWFLVAVGLSMMAAVGSTGGTSDCGIGNGGSSASSGSSSTADKDKERAANTLQVNGDYFQETSDSSCESGGAYSITDSTECRKALQELNFIRLTRDSFSREASYPVGCFGENGYGALNTDTSSSKSCSSSTPCICSSVATSRSSTCANEGVSCAKSASAKPGSTICQVSIDQNKMNAKDTDCSNDGPACCAGLTEKSTKYRDAGGSILCDPSNCNIGGGGDMCSCGNPDVSDDQNCCGSGIGFGALKMGMCPACPLAISASGIYSLKTGGLCEERYQAITTAADCQAAATALGFSGAYIYNTVMSGKPSGCIITPEHSAVTFNSDDNNQQCTGKY